MSYLVDTNAISEFKKKTPNQNVLDWFAAQTEESLFLSVITIVLNGAREISKTQAKALAAKFKVSAELFI